MSQASVPAVSPPGLEPKTRGNKQQTKASTRDAFLFSDSLPPPAAIFHGAKKPKGTRSSQRLIRLSSRKERPVQASARSALLCLSSASLISATPQNPCIGLENEKHGSRDIPTANFARLLLPGDRSTRPCRRPPRPWPRSLTTTTHGTTRQTTPSTIRATRLLQPQLQTTARRCCPQHRPRIPTRRRLLRRTRLARCRTIITTLPTATPWQMA